MTCALVRRRPLVLPLGTPPLISLNAVTANGTGTAYNLGHAFSNWEVQVTTTGSPGGFSVQLQGSLDGATFVNIGSPITVVGLTNVTANTPLSSVQLVLSGLTGGTNPTVTATVAATEAPAGAGGGGGGGAVTQSTGAGAAAPWSVELSDGAAFYVSAKDTTLTTTNTQIGAVTETAPATDTASAGLNGRLQRIAQRLTSLIGLLPAALVGGRLDVNIGAQTGTVTVADSAAETSLAALVTATDFDAKVGSVTETAPASDTASSGLNGRLQRIAQRLTSLIALLPAALVGGRLDVNLGAAPAAVTLGAGAAAVGTVGVTSNVTPADRTATGAVAAINANVALTPNGCGTVTAAIATNASWNGTLTFQATTDGSNWLAIAALNVNTGGFGQTYATANTSALFQLSTAGYSQVRVIALTYSAGSATVTLEGSAGSSCFPGLLDSSGRLIAVGAAASGAALAGNPVRQGISDGTNTQDWKQYVSQNTAQAVTGVPAVGLMAASIGANNLISVHAQSPGDGKAFNQVYLNVLAQGAGYNGSTSDLSRHNIDVTLLASAARTTTQTSADITTYNNLGIVLTTDITAISGGQTITTTINGKDPSSGKYYLILSSTAYAATATNLLRVAPGLTASPNLTANDHLPRVIQIVTTLSNGVSTTFGVGYTLLV